MAIAPASKRSDHEVATALLRHDVHDSVDLLITMAKSATRAELLYFVQLLHWIRLIDHFSNYVDSAKEDQGLVITIAPRIEESLKYLIACIKAVGGEEYPLDGHGNPILDGDLTQRLLKQANETHAKSDMFTLAELSQVVARPFSNGRVRLEFQKRPEPENKKFVEYSNRLSLANQIQWEGRRRLDDLLRMFAERYSDCERLVEAEFGVSPEEFTHFVRYVCGLVSEALRSAEGKMVLLPNGCVDVQLYQNICLFWSCMIHSKADVLHALGARYAQVMERLTFRSADWNRYELRYDWLSRCPLLESGDKLIISPELLVDSLFINTHYTLLESATQRDAYKDIVAQTLVDEISVAAAAHGFQEAGRGIVLREGKRDLGDIDAVLRKDDEFLLIEAKNHALPLDVYFQDSQATRDRLAQLKETWEARVINRIKHLGLHHTEYGIGSGFRYIIVSRFPEILSHDTAVMTLSLEEFRHWLANWDKDLGFAALCSILYGDRQQRFSDEQFSSMRESGLLVYDMGPG